MESEEWVPHSEFYLERADQPYVRQTRPLCQGDVFVDIPVALYRRFPPKRAGEYPTAANEQIVMLYSHPCSIFEGPAPSRVQQVIVVTPASSYFPTTPWNHPWEGNFRLFPLPGLIGDADYVADIGQIAVTRADYFDDRRIACLNFPQLAAFQGRCARFVSRMNPPLAEHKRRVEPLWEEYRLWEKWWQVSGHSHGFQEWLDEPSRSRPPTTRRQMLLGAPDEVEAEMDEDLAGTAASEE